MCGRGVDPLAEWDQGGASSNNGRGGHSGGTAGSSGKALPSPGEILRMNASGAAMSQPQPSKLPQLDARAERDKEIKALIQEEHAIKSNSDSKAKEWGVGASVQAAARGQGMGHTLVDANSAAKVEQRRGNAWK